MMKKLLLLVVPVLLTGCATKIAFTPNYIDEYKLDGEAVKDLQFYTSGKIVLTRAIVSEVTGKEDHQLKRIRDRYVEVVTIREDTPGKITEIGENTLKVCFEDGGVLTFVSNELKKPYKEHTSNTNLDRFRMYRLAYDGVLARGEGTYLEYGPYIYQYNGKTFTSFDYRNVYLKVDRDSIERLSKKRMVAPGCRFPVAGVAQN